MTRRAPLAPVSVPVSMALVMLALGAILLAQGQTPPTPPGVRTPGAAAPAGAPAATAKITGQVLAADTSLPVKRAIVRARGGTLQPPPAGAERAPLQMPVGGSGSTVPPGMAQREVTTDDTGSFEMLDLPAGRYSVSVQAPAMFTPPPMQSVQLSAGGSASVTFKLDRGGAIMGRVLDHEGDPLVRAQVTALQRRNLGGAWRLMPAGASPMGNTDDQGQFRLFGLPPGEYYVVASYLVPGPMIDQPGSDSQPKLGYAPTFYPSTPALEGAQKVIVRAGQDTAGIDVLLARAKLGTVSGRATDSTGSPLTGQRGYVSLMPAGQMSVPIGSGGSMRRRDDGTFVVWNVPPGRYILSATAGLGESPNGGSREAAYKPVAVDGDDVVVDIQTNTGATVSGRVVVEGASPAQRPSTSGPMAGVRARVSTRPVDMGNSMGVSVGTGVNVGEDLAFQLTGLRGALALSATGPRMTLKSVTCAGEDITLKGLDLAGTEKTEGVTITLTTDVAMIDGIVTTTAGDPGDAWVVVFPEDASKWVPGSPFVRTARTRPSPATMAAGRGASAPGVQPASAYANRQGGFVMNGLLPGRYHVAAVPYSPDPNSPSGLGPATDRDSLEKLRASAKTVGAAVGQAASVELRLPK